MTSKCKHCGKSFIHMADRDIHQDNCQVWSAVFNDIRRYPRRDECKVVFTVDQTPRPVHHVPMVKVLTVDIFSGNVQMSNCADKEQSAIAKLPYASSEEIEEAKQSIQYFIQPI